MQKGRPEELAGDFSSIFLSRKATAWCEEQRMQRFVAAPHAHKSNGLVERAVQTLIGRLRRLMWEQRTKDWSSVLSTAVEVMNFTPHETTKQVPEEMWQASKEMWEQAREHMQKTRQEANQRYWQRITKRNYQLGQQVLIYDHERKKQLDDKFSPFWKGPWTLLRQKTKTIWLARDLRGKERMVHTDSLRPFET